MVDYWLHSLTTGYAPGLMAMLLDYTARILATLLDYWLHSLATGYATGLVEGSGHFVCHEPCNDWSE